MLLLILITVLLKYSCDIFFLVESSNEEMTNEEGAGGEPFSLSFPYLLFSCRALVELCYFNICPDETMKYEVKFTFFVSPV